MCDLLLCVCRFKCESVFKRRVNSDGLSINLLLFSWGKKSDSIEIVSLCCYTYSMRIGKTTAKDFSYIGVNSLFLYK